MQIPALRYIRALHEHSRQLPMFLFPRLPRRRFPLRRYVRIIPPPRCIGCFYSFLFCSHVSADINECDNPAFAARCVENAECCNLPSNFLCKCKPGYIGDGEVHCEDVNECVIPGACGDNTVCNNIPGNYTCACQPGFTGDPYESVSNFRHKVSFSRGVVKRRTEWNCFKQF